MEFEFFVRFGQLVAFGQASDSTFGFFLDQVTLGSDFLDVKVIAGLITIELFVHLLNLQVVSTLNGSQRGILVTFELNKSAFICSLSVLELSLFVLDRNNRIFKLLLFVAVLVGNISVQLDVVLLDCDVVRHLHTASGSLFVLVLAELAL